MKEKLFIPNIEKEEISLEDLKNILFYILRDSPDQQRNKSLMVRNPLLDKAAQQKATDMASNHYFAHTSPSGITANQNVRSTGYLLPESYPIEGNNVESLYIGTDVPSDAALAWFQSDHHRPHVYGQDISFRDQNCIGIGMAPVQKEQHRAYWTFISAPCS